MRNILCFCFLIAASLAVRHKEEIGSYPIDPDAVSVSGLSSGGFMAAQYQVAYSSQIVGAGIFAGGPYYCAQGQLYIALSQCMYTDIGMSVSGLVTKTKSFASSGKIDPISNTLTQKLYVYSGLKDTTVVQAVVKDLVSFYTGLGIPSSNIQTQFTLQANHAMPTNYYGGSCTYLGSPYINNCNYDGSGFALDWIYGHLNPKVTANNNNIVSFSQSPFIPNGATPASISMGPNAYMYVPTNCTESGANCKLHVVFHGCKQTLSDIQLQYVEDTGYNNWAESNNIIVLYPQAIASTALSNPNGCWDWWGYTNANYVYKNGVQMQTISNMIAQLSGQSW